MYTTASKHSKDSNLFTNPIVLADDKQAKMDIKDIQISLHKFAQELSERCDYAARTDGAGFNKFDAHFGHALAQDSDPTHWSNRKTRAAYKMIRKYRKQLDSYGFDFASVSEPPVVVEKTKVKTSRDAADDREVTFDGEKYLIKFEKYDPDFPSLLNAVKTTIPRRKFDWDTLGWTVPDTPDNAHALMELASEWKFSMDKSAVTQMETTLQRPVRYASIGQSGSIMVEFPFDQKIYAHIKDIPSASWKAKVKAWEVKPEFANSEGLLKLLAEFDFEIEPDVLELVHEVVEKGLDNIEASRAHTGDLEIEGILGTPYPFQLAGVQYALDKKAMIFGDEMGLGKTVQAILVAHLTGLKGTVVACPASVKLNWAKEVLNWLPNVTVGVLEGRKEMPASTSSVNTWHGHREIHMNRFDVDVLIVNYSILPAHVDSLLARGVSTLICDESHYIKNGKTKRGKAVFALSREAEYKLLLSGTPIKNRPAEYIHQLKVLDRLEEFGGEWKFKMRYCKGQHNGFGWEFNGATNLPELNQRLRASCFIRRMKKDVMTELPPITHTSVPMSITNREEYDYAVDNTMDYIYTLAKKDPELWAEIKQLLSSQDVDVDKLVEEYANDKVDRASRAEHLVRLAVLRQLAARGKMKAVKTWVKMFLESDEKIILFAVHRSVQKELMEEFPDAAHVLGDDSAEVRQANVERFQDDPDCRVIVCSLYAAAEGITLTAASNVAFVQLGWTPAETSQAIARAHRIGQDRDNVGVWYLDAVETVEEEISALIQKKSKVIEAAADGDLDAEVELGSVLRELLESINGKEERSTQETTN